MSFWSCWFYWSSRCHTPPTKYHSTFRAALLRANPSPTDVEIDFDGRVFWNGTAVADDQRLAQWFSTAAEAPGVIRILPDRRVRYERVAQILASAQRAHVTRLAVVPVAN
jgi:biopolymer transport protein ExbD